METDRDGASGVEPAVPSYLTKFIGRDHELARLQSALGDPDVRWITLTGPGGVGKTRLAIETVSHVANTRNDGTAEFVFVPLFGVPSIDLAIETIARRLDPTALDADSIAVIARNCEQRRIVLLLDNADEIVAGGGVLAALLGRPECDGVTLLITSRTPFTIAGEHLMTLNPLPIATPAVASTDELRASPAVALFLDRAHAARLDISISDADVLTIAAICQRVDCLPLAIELAANRLRQLSLPAIASSLEASRFSVDASFAPHALPGHTGLFESIASSFELLTADQQELLMRLSVFTGGISIKSAERMAEGLDPTDGYPAFRGYDTTGFGRFEGDRDDADDAPRLRQRGYRLNRLELDVVETLEMLADRSLLQRSTDPFDAPRFQFLETINEFAQNRLVASGNFEAVNHAQMTVMLALVEVACQGLWTAHRFVVPIELIDVELANIRRSIAWLFDQGADAADLTTRICDILLVYWQMRGQYAEGISLVSRALEQPDVNTFRRSCALTTLGFALWMTGDTEQSEARLNESIALVAGPDSGSFEARPRFFLALVEWRKGPDRATAALGQLQEAMRLFASWNDGIGLGVCHLALGEVVRTAGDTPAALDHFNQALGFFEEARYRWGRATALWFIGEAERAAGNERRSAEHLAMGLTGYQSIGDRLGMAGCLAGIAALLASRQEWATSARLFGAASALREHTQSRLPPTHESDHETIATLVVQTIGTAEFVAGRTGDHDATVNEAHRIARAISTGNPIDPAPQLKAKKLSQARREVLLLLGEGHDVKSIALRLDRQLSTIYHHLDGLMDDLECSSREELRARAQLIAATKPAPELPAAGRGRKAAE